MTKTFWIRLTVLMAIVTALAFYRVSANKIKEQNIIAEVQLHQSLASIAFFQQVSQGAASHQLFDRFSARNS